ncbi:hypothetical protein ACFE04_022111 [Oxalis oulophora]
MNLSEVKTNETRSSDQPLLELEDYLAQFDNPGKTKRKRTERIEFYTKPASSSEQSGKKKGASHLQTKSHAMIQAEELQLNLESDFPSIIITMLKSHVTTCFWMRFPGPFAREHLPREVTSMTLETENGAVFIARYIAYKAALCKGWKKFVRAQHLLEGDVVIFQLTEPRSFKVYIRRAGELAAVDGMQSENDSEVVGSEVMEGYKLPTPTFQFNHVKSFNDFVILVDGSIVGSELQENIRKKYYDLCRSQNAFLHENIAPGLHHKLIVGTIREIVNIADALSNCKLTTSRDDFSCWEKFLKAFELLGMNVGFLVARLNKLVKLAFESEGGSSTRGYAAAEAKTEKNIAEEVEAKVKMLKKDSGECEAEIESLKPEADEYEVKFQKEAAAPW